MVEVMCLKCLECRQADSFQSLINDYHNKISLIQKVFFVNLNFSASLLKTCKKTQNLESPLKLGT